MEWSMGQTSNQKQSQGNDGKLAEILMHASGGLKPRLKFYIKRELKGQCIAGHEVEMKVLIIKCIHV